MWFWPTLKPNCVFTSEQWCEILRSTILGAGVGGGTRFACKLVPNVTLCPSYSWFILRIWKRPLNHTPVKSIGKSIVCYATKLFKRCICFDFQLLLQSHVAPEMWTWWTYLAPLAVQAGRASIVRLLINMDTRTVKCATCLQTKTPSEHCLYISTEKEPWRQGIKTLHFRGSLFRESSLRNVWPLMFCPRTVKIPHTLCLMPLDLFLRCYVCRALCS